MKINKAVNADVDQICSLTESCTKHMIENGIFQWDVNYPSKEVLQNDIELQQIWKLEDSEAIVGIIVLTETENEEYKNVKWLTKNSKNVYIHRLAVHPVFQGKGYAQKLMDFAESYAINNHYSSIRLDTFSKNKRNQKFYELRGYQRLGDCYFSNQSEDPFYCYELILKNSLLKECKK